MSINKLKQVMQNKEFIADILLDNLDTYIEQLACHDIHCRECVFSSTWADDGKYCHRNSTHKTTDGDKHDFAVRLRDELKEVYNA